VPDVDVTDFMELYRGKEGEDVVVHFIENLLHYGDRIKSILKGNEKMISTEEQHKELNLTNT
jgi:hypothetical protein